MAEPEPQAEAGRQPGLTERKTSPEGTLHRAKIGPDLNSSSSRPIPPLHLNPSSSRPIPPLHLMKSTGRLPRGFGYRNLPLDTETESTSTRSPIRYPVTGEVAQISANGTESYVETVPF